MISAPGPLGFSHGRATLRLEQERNGPHVRERFHGIFFAGAPDNTLGALPASNRRHALCISLAAPIVGARGGGAVLVRCFTVDTARVPHPSVHLPLRTEDADWETPALRHSRRSSRLSERRTQARDAAQHQRSTGVSFLRRIPSDFRAPDAGRLCGTRIRLRVLRHAPLRDASFPHETRRMAVAETVSSSPPLQR